MLLNHIIPVNRPNLEKKTLKKKLGLNQKVSIIYPGLSGFIGDYIGKGIEYQRS